MLIISAVTVFSSSCLNEEAVGLSMNEAIVLDLSSGLTKADVDDQVEKYVNHLDVFIFKAAQSRYDSELVNYGRYQVNNASTVTLSAKRSSFEEGQEYYVYLLANSNISQSEFASDRYTVLRDLLDRKQVDENIYLSGLTLDIAPKYFLMDAVATAEGSELIVINNGVTTDNTVMNAELKRAAAKVVINITAAANITFRSFPNEPLSEGGRYYVRNLPYDAYLLAEAKSSDQIDAELRTPIKGVSQYLKWSPETDSKNMSLTTFVYPHHWTNESLLEDETCVILNLPLTHTVDNVSTDYHNSWYKIHMTSGTMFERNKYYEVNITLGRPGALSESKPVLVDQAYYDVEDWIPVSVDVDGSTRPQYLHLNADHVDMYNVNTDSGSLIFASSSPIPANGIELLEAYYFNSVDARVDVSSKYAQAYRGIKASADADVLNGSISITSPFVADGTYSDSHSNTIRYMRFRVTNATGQTAEFTVSQYPTIYITNELGQYSYRSDFGGTHYGFTGNPNYSGVNWSTSNGGSWTYTQQSSVNNHFFGSKYVRSGPDSSGKYDIECVYRNGNTNQNVTDGTFNNPRMYHVHVTATSSKYILAKPRLDADGFTESSPENTKLVSPSFMIASQLGATNIPSGIGSNNYGVRELPGGIRQAKMHCEQYIEVTDGKVYDDWRLPTAAEIDIIIQHQKSSDAMAEVLSGSRYYCAYNLDSGQPEHTKSSEGGNSGSCHVRCIRDAY